MPVVSKGVTDIRDGVKIGEDNRCQIVSVDNDVLGYYVDWGLFYAATMLVVEMPMIRSWKKRGTTLTCISNSTANSCTRFRRKVVSFIVLFLFSSSFIVFRGKRQHKGDFKNHSFFSH